ncbi:isochorismate synthase [Pseudomonas sp. Z1-29]|uniref:isochorismate synthase n=1 Tax=Pseudomonas sp. Z1-29 TaxID=2817410 RepID=UPI003DA7C89C
MSILDVDYTGLYLCIEEAHKKALETASPVLAAFSCVVATVDPLSLLERAQGYHDSYAFWKARDPAVCMFGWGTEVEINVQGETRFSEVQALWRSLLEHSVCRGPLGPRLVGGFRFDVDGDKDPCWRDFPDACMSLYKTLVVHAPDRDWLLCHCYVDPGADVALLVASYKKHIELLCGREKKLAHGSSNFALYEPANAGQWKSKARLAVEKIQCQAFTKVVLARSVQQVHDEPINPGALVRALSSNSQAHLFAFSRGDSCFVGATPERLACVLDGNLHTHALAGTTRRDEDAAIDRRLGEMLFESSKERHEHALVVEAIREALTPLVSELEISQEPTLHCLPKVQHLNTAIRAQVKGEVSLLNIVAAMHPTPAVAGHSRQAALDYIRKHEELDRGWYAAPLGWLDADGNGDFIVGLRSALVSGVNCRLFAGCGIVSDSDPEQEYQETCLKLSGLQQALIDSARPIASLMLA